MARSFRGGTALLLAALGASSLLACSSHEDSPSAVTRGSGQIGMQLTIGGGVTLAQVHYEITGNGIAPITGDIPVDASGATASVLVRLLAGTGYVASFSATDVSGKTSCTGTASFDVTAGQTNGVSVPLVCGSVTTRGNAKFNGAFNTCPEIAQLAVAPLELNPGGKINVSASAVDADGNSLSYAWTATGGIFDAPTAATTKYNCTAGGPQVLTIGVSDGHGCVSTLAVDVNCNTGGECGDDVVDLGEQCDPPSTATCTASCQFRRPQCGDGFITPPETCEPPNTPTCSVTCQTRTATVVCGDGVISGSEQCEPPNTATCTALCQNRITECGDGAIEPPEQCEPPNTATCDANCLLIASPEPTCASCIDQSCSDLAQACATVSGCDAVSACIKSSGCGATTTRDDKECYCGSVDDSTCFGFNPNAPQGPCKAVMDAAAPGGPLAVGSVFFDTSSPIGAAVQTSLCSNAFCGALCNPL